MILFNFVREEASSSKKRKRKATNGEESGDEEENKKRRRQAEDPEALPLYAEDLGEEHRELVQKSFSQIRRLKAAEEEQKANNYSPGKKITPRKKK